MSKRIVVGVDGSQTAEAAAQIAGRLAQQSDSELLVLSAYGKFQVEKVKEGSDEYVFTSDSAARSVAEQGALALRRQFSELVVTARSAEGRPAEALVRVAEEIEADLIVVGNKRVQGLARVLGSIATDVARKAPCDVYIAHTHQR